LTFSRRIKLPYNFIAFSVCGVCGQTWPSAEIMYNPRWGWQCPPCWDGMISRDQIMRPIFPFEGTRKYASPVVPNNEGLNSTTDTPYYIYTLFDRGDKSITYDMTFGDYITFTTPSTRVGTDGVSPDGGIQMNNGWTLYIQDDYLFESHNFKFLNQSAIYSIATWSGAGDLFVDADGYLNYTPYVPGTITGLSS